MRGTCRGKGHDGVGSRDDPLLRTHRIRIRPRRNVDRNHRCLTRIQQGDGVGIQSSDRRLESRPKNRIEIQIRSQRELHALVFQIFAGVDYDGWLRQHHEHGSSVTVQILPIGQQDDLHRLLCLMQLAGSHESVAAIVALAAEDHNLLGIEVVRENIFRHGGPGIFHQRQGGDAEALAGRAVDGAHFCRSYDFHAILILMTKRKR